MMTNVMTKITARHRILIYLQSHNGVTAAELARALQVTAANVRHHLSILVRDGRVQVLGKRAPGDRGRPIQVYGLSDAAIGDNLPALADALLAQWLEQLPLDEQAGALQKLAERIADGLEAAPSGHITRRLAQAVEQLNRLGYQARWEAHARGPRLIFEHCPYAAIIQKHPELCRMDAHLLTGRLGAPVEQFARLERNERGVPVCVFLIQ